jgi:hypothetical protein
MPSIKVGTCDWDMDIYDCYMRDGESTCQTAVSMDKDTFKIGTAWATWWVHLSGLWVLF